MPVEIIMKAEVKENEIVKHWGIWLEDDDGEGWIRDYSGIIVHFTCPIVANVQHDLIVEEGDWKPEQLTIKVIA